MQIKKWFQKTAAIHSANLSFNKPQECYTVIHPFLQVLVILFRFTSGSRQQKV